MPFATIALNNYGLCNFTNIAHGQSINIYAYRLQLPLKHCEHPQTNVFFNSRDQRHVIFCTTKNLGSASFSSNTPSLFLTFSFLFQVHLTHIYFHTKTTGEGLSSHFAPYKMSSLNLCMCTKENLTLVLYFQIISFLNS